MSAAERLTRYAWLSIGAALVTMAMKGTAAWLTGSVAILSDALESVINLVAAVVALVALSIAARPADDSHEFGHTKAEYFSAAIEGAMIIVAAVLIGREAVLGLLHPTELEDLGIGLGVTVLASLVNLAVSVVLRRAATKHRSITLEADSRHLMTDVWTSGGVVVGVALVALTGWDRLDPLVALAVAANIVYAGVQLIRRSGNALMDASLPPADHVAVEQVLDRYRSFDVRFHALRTRQAGRRSFASLHMLVPGAWTVQHAHDMAERIEGDLARAVPGLNTSVHVEPLEDPASFADLDLDLDRSRPPPSRRDIPPERA